MNFFALVSNFLILPVTFTQRMIDNDAGGLTYFTTSAFFKNFFHSIAALCFSFLSKQYHFHPISRTQCEIYLIL